MSQNDTNDDIIRLNVSSTDITAYLVYQPDGDKDRWFLVDDEWERHPCSSLGDDLGPSDAEEAKLRAKIWVSAHVVGYRRGHGIGELRVQRSICSALGIPSNMYGRT